MTYLPIGVFLEVARSTRISKYLEMSEGRNASLDHL